MEELMLPCQTQATRGGGQRDGQASHKRPSADDACADDSLPWGEPLVAAYEQRSKAGSDLLLGRPQSVIDHIL